ncbi:MAG: PspC domain-containing protein [Candidatus Woesearchaeota archaeon]
MPKYFYRSRKNKMIAGVAGGIAEYFDVDPVLIRAVFIIGIFAGGISFPAYIVLWIIMPEEDRVTKTKVEEKVEVEISPEEEHYHKRRSNNFKILAGIVLIALGIIILFDRIFHWFNIHDFWPVILIIIGIFILMKPSKHNLGKH